MVRILAFMGGSAADIPAAPDERPSPGLRASDAERDAVAARLRDEFVAGRLSHDTFVHRMDAVLGARQRADLPPLIADLPPPGQAPEYQELQYQAPQYQAAQHQPPEYQAGRRPGPRPLVERLRGAVSRLAGHARREQAAGHATRTEQPGAVPREHATGPHPAAAAAPAPAPAPAASAGGVVRSTTGIRAANSSPAPLPLQFPRGAGEEFSIGRDASCDLAIADMTVSRRHAALERTPEGWLISDLESTNGTRVNGWRVRGKVVVRPGDRISFGNLEAVFAREDTAPPAAPPVMPGPASPLPPPAGSPAPRPAPG